MARTGRPKKTFNKKAFSDLVGFGCTQEEICWFFRDEGGKPANIDTLTRWCKREYGMTFQEFKIQNNLMALKIQVRKNQLELSKKSATMAIWLGKQYLNQEDKVTIQSYDEKALDELETLVLLDEEADEGTSDTATN